MERFLIKGGKRLSGEIEVRGAKNSALKILPASLLFSSPIIIKNLPLIEDVFRMRELLEELGVKVNKIAERSLKLNPRPLMGQVLKPEVAERFRASVVLAGPLLARQKKIFFPHPGGCLIGKRPINIFLEGWQAMGAKIHLNKNGYAVRAKTLRGADFTFRTISVTATETLMMTAVLAHGKTILRNVALEPEIPHLAEFLNNSGAKIKGAGTPTMEIIGTGGRLLRTKKNFEIMPDRIEAGDFLILGAALGKNIKIKKCNPEHLRALIAELEICGVNIKMGVNWLKVSRPQVLRSTDIKTREYPWFVTDLQAPFTVLMTQAKGQSLIFETVFNGRLNYIEHLNKMGANIIPLDQHRILVTGPSRLQGSEIESSDLRAGLAFVIAALVAKGVSKINNIYQIDRGYEKIEERLQKLGADIKRI